MIALAVAALSYGAAAQSTGKLSSAPAITTLSAYPADDTKNAQAAKYRNAGIASAMKRDFPAAISNFTKAVDADPKYADAYRRRGAIYSDSGEHDKAIADFSEAIKLTPTNTLLYLCRGTEFLFFKKDYKAAIADATKGLRIDPKDTVLYRLRAMSYQAFGQQDLADADWEKVRQLHRSPH